MSANVIIVGAGPAGAMLAYLLASRGVATTLVERQSDFAREFRGEGMTPSGQRVLREAGLWEPFDQLPHTTVERAEVYYRGSLIAGEPVAWTDSEPPRFVSQPRLLEMLVSQASSLPGFMFLRGVRVIGLEQERGRVTGVRLAGRERDSVLAGDYVFAADGRFSMLRREASLDEPRKPQAFDVVWCKVPMPPFLKGRPMTVRGYLGNGHLGIFVPSYDGLLQVGWVIGKGRYPDFKAIGIDGWIEEMAKHVSADLAEHLRRSRRAVSQPFLLDVVCDCYRHWSTPGLLLIGDAAHPMSPVGSQGINIALRDAVVAANRFVPLLKGAARIEDLNLAAQAYEAERRPEVETIQAAQRKVPKLLFRTGRRADAVATVVRMVSRLGLARPLALLGRRRREAFLNGVTEVRLEV